MFHSSAIRLPDSLTTVSGYPLPLAARLALRFAAVVTQWDINHRTRRQLRKLDDHLLRDIGIERDAAYTEARRPFWQ